jgi:DNA-binding transcriptional LysR family regulator
LLSNALLYQFLCITVILMTLVQLRHFIVLAEQGSFVKASRACFITQPALSRSIASLEDELGQALFDRIGRRVVLSHFGQDALGLARRVLDDVAGLKSYQQRLASGEVGSIRVGLSSGPGAVLATPLALHMARSYPQVRLALSRGNTDLLLHALRSERLDAIVVDIRSIRPSSDLRIEHQVEMRAGFLAHARHPLHRRGGRLGFVDVLQYPIASTPLSDEVARLLIAQYGPRANPDDMVTLRSDDIATLTEAAQTSPLIVLTISAAAGRLKQLPVMPALTATARFGLVTLAQRTPPPAIDQIRKVMQQTLRDPTHK